MVESSTMGKLAWLWIIIPAVAVLEIFFQWRIPLSEPSDRDWKEAAKAITGEKKAGDLVIIAPDWASQGRMFLKGLITVDDFGRFNTTTYKRIHELSINGARSKETEGLTPKSEKDFGRITLRKYELPPPEEILYDFGKHVGSAKPEGFKPRRPRLIIDHWFFPRLAIHVPLVRKGMAALTYENVPLNGVLSVHAVIGYREARGNKGTPVRLSAFVNGKRVINEQIENFRPITPIKYPIHEAAQGTVRFEVQAKDWFKREFGLQADVRREP